MKFLDPNWYLVLVEYFAVEEIKHEGNRGESPARIVTTGLKVFRSLWDFGEYFKWSLRSMLGFLQCGWKTVRMTDICSYTYWIWGAECCANAVLLVIPGKDGMLFHFTPKILKIKGIDQ